MMRIAVAAAIGLLATAAGALAQVPPPISHEYADVNGGRLHYAKAGSGPLIVFLHGFPEFWYEWKNRSEEHTSELQSPVQLVCRLLPEKKNASMQQRSSPKLTLSRRCGPTHHRPLTRLRHYRRGDTTAREFRWRHTRVGHPVQRSVYGR